ncbi:protocatechuate 3,4-dioxygenase [Thalassotalea fonticola]|uniref:Protocatechuate 3,4-dioxygenase n=1 Tax=Thalassotalea fonticola TaxID=3065649 RepID=A0ABZ0GQX3_9GAMM|nr:protocatechuate 3,4-dioxygenase [Colwelliaceae bacterium S1-1]
MAKHNISRRYFLSASAALASLFSTSLIAKEINPTAKQQEGPYYPKHKQADKNANMNQVDGNNGHANGEVITIHGRVIDTDGSPVGGALIDIWQADKNGRYLHDDAPKSSPIDANFQYWAQLKTDSNGTYSVKTIKPGKYPAMGDWVRPPHIHFKIARRGLRELTTQMYFANEPLNEIDKLYLETPEKHRASIVVDFKEGQGSFNIVLEKV